MGTYVALMNFTEQGITTIKDFPARLKTSQQMVEAAGGKILATYATMGKYDLVTIVEGPSDEAAMAVLLQLGMAGNVRTTTLKAFGMQEFAAILQKLT